MHIHGADSILKKVKICFSTVLLNTLSSAAAPFSLIRRSIHGKNKFSKTFIYISIALLVNVMTVLTTACASTGSGKSSGMELVYEIDFSTDDGMFDFHDPVERQISEIKNGVLHFNGKSPGGNLPIPLWQRFRNYFSS